MSCPFMSAGIAASLTNSASDISKCPMHAQILAAQQQQEHGAAAPPAAAVCPLGFGSSRGPKLSTLHCPVCKGLLFDAHMSTSCKHTFCHSCLSRTRDCPVCGMDVEGVEPNTELAGLVDTFLDTHSKSPELVAAQTDIGPLPDNSEASFFLAQGLKSLAGGNFHAALHRLSRCKEALLHAAAAGTKQDSHSQASIGSGAAGAGAADLQGAAAAAAAAAESVSASDAAEDRSTELDAVAIIPAACQMATVCGSIGDCYQRLGDAVQAEQMYHESMAAVEPYSDSDAEAAHALSVSLNKLGDMRYSQQQLQQAKQLYRRALQLRQLACGPLTGGRAGPGQQLELASSLIKVADVCRALCEHEEAEQLLRTAAGVCFEVQLQAAELAPGTARKLQVLLDVLHAQGSAAAC